jgi:hypothetical protein
MAGYYYLFVGLDHLDADIGIGRGNHRGVDGIGRGGEANPEIA